MRHGWRGWGPVGNGEGGKASVLRMSLHVSPRNCMSTGRANPFVKRPMEPYSLASGLRRVGQARRIGAGHAGRCRADPQVREGGDPTRLASHRRPVSGRGNVARGGIA